MRIKLVMKRVEWMKKRKSSILFILICLVLFPIYCLADTSSCEISLGKNSKNTLTKGDTVIVNVGLDKETSDALIYELDYNVTYDNELFDLLKENNHYVKTSSNWNILEENITTTSDNHAILSFKIATNDQSRMIKNNGIVDANSVANLKFRVKSTESDLLGKNSNTNIVINNNSIYKMYLNTVSDENKKEQTCNRNTLTLYLKSSINTLSSIKLDNIEVADFEENKEVYNITLPSSKDKVNIEVTKKDSKATVSGTLGTKELKYGLNIFYINVTSESGTVKNYTLYVTRPDNRSSINTLKTLKLSSGIINFKSDINDYVVNVENSVNTIKITSSLTDPKAKYVEDYSNKEITLLEGNNKVVITVIAENGNENTYTININRELSGNNILKKLMVDDNEIPLNEQDFLYTYTVENNVVKVNIKAQALDNKAQVEIDRINNLEIGENEIGIYVTAPNGDVSRYTLYITRKPVLSNNAYLKELKIDGYNIAFNREEKYYNLKIKDEDELVISAISDDEKATVNIDGNKNLINGSIIKIIVKAEDGSINRYFINIEKKEKKSLLWLILLLILLIIMATILIIVLMKKNDKEKEKEDLKDNNVPFEDQEDMENDVSDAQDVQQKPIEKEEYEKSKE